MKSIYKILVLFTALNLIACGKGFQNSTKASAGDQNTPNQGQDVSTPPTSDPLQDVQFKGRINNGGSLAGQGQLALEIDRPNQALILILPVPAEILPFIGPIVEMPIPDLPGAKVMPYNKQIAVSVPLKYIVRGGEFMDKNFSNLLPNGDILPRFPAGEGAGFALKITKSYVVNVYIGVSAAAVFIETPDWDSFMNCSQLGLPICPPLGPFEVRNEAQTEVIGYTALIPAKSSFHSGVYVASEFSAPLARFINEHVRY